jgi:hypothetical protein
VRGGRGGTLLVGKMTEEGTEFRLGDLQGRESRSRKSVSVIPSKKRRMTYPLEFRISDTACSGLELSSPYNSAPNHVMHSHAGLKSDENETLARHMLGIS